MSKKQGVIKQIEVKLQGIEDRIDEYYESARKLQDDADKLRLNTHLDVKEEYEAQELYKQAQNHINLAQRLADDRFMVQRELRETEEKAMFIRRSIDSVKLDMKNVKNRKEELKREFKAELEQLDRDIDFAQGHVVKLENDLQVLEG